MDLLQLEHFLAVVEEGTFTRAAERVCRTQPAVSQSIKKLEEEIGAPLFARDVHELSLTEAGRVLADYARRMVYREQGYQSDPARELIKLVRNSTGTRSARRPLPAGGATRFHSGRAPDLPVRVMCRCSCAARMAA
jgi:DNA-binding transcriptional LysR family regulator